MTRPFGTSTNTFLRPALLVGDCESARSTWPAEEAPRPQRHLQLRLQLRLQLLPQLRLQPQLHLQLQQRPERRLRRGLVPLRRRGRSEVGNSFVGEADSFPYS